MSMKRRCWDSASTEVKAKQKNRLFFNSIKWPLNIYLKLMRRARRLLPPFSSVIIRSKPRSKEEGEEGEGYIEEKSLILRCNFLPAFFRKTGSSSSSPFGASNFTPLFLSFLKAGKTSAFRFEKERGCA